MSGIVDMIASILPYPLIGIWGGSAALVIYYAQLGYNPFLPALWLYGIEVMVGGLVSGFALAYMGLDPTLVLLGSTIGAYSAPYIANSMNA